MNVCRSGECTACGACLNICPHSCIEYRSDDLEVKSAYILEDNCVHCNLCKKVCPIENKVVGSKSELCYAAWSLDDNVRLASASGGIATEFYRYAASHGCFFAGVRITDEMEARYYLEDADWKSFSNSKYVYSDMSNIYGEIRGKLAAKTRGIFVGLPCQVAGLKNYLKALKCPDDNLLTIDLVCHGVTPPDYLKGHVKDVEKRYKKPATEVLFRDPDFYTYTYTFTLKNGADTFYKKKVHRNDAYQIAYHKGIAYRENCYTCKFANEMRQGDLTLSDFAGVGTKAECGYDNKNVSCILVNTTKGRNWLQCVGADERIYLEPRPIEEEYLTESRLHSPTPVPKERNTFVKVYSESRNFKKAMKKAAGRIILKNELKHTLRIEKMKSIGASILPVSVKKKIRKLLKQV